MITLTLLPEEYSIFKLNPADPLPQWILQQRFFSVTRTPYELSIVTSHNENIPADASKSDGWRMMMINGPLGFGLVGIIAGVTSVLKQSNIPVFVVSTFDTDYFLLKAEFLDEAVSALGKEDYCFRNK